MQNKSKFVLVGSILGGLLGLNTLLLISNNITQIINPYDLSFSELEAKTILCCTALSALAFTAMIFFNRSETFIYFRF